MQNALVLAWALLKAQKFGEQASETIERTL